MLKMVQFTLPGEPTTEARARVFNDAEGKTRCKNTDAVTVAQKAIFYQTVKYRQRPLPLDPVFIRLDFYRKPPTWFTDKEREMAYAGEILPTITPDNDNYEKLVWDALRKIMYEDDAQITDNFTRQRYGRNPRTDVTIVYLNQKRTRRATEHETL